MFLFLIWGTHTFRWTDEQGERQPCPLCGCQRSIFPAKQYTFLHLYFVPLLPVCVDKFFKCRCCRAKFLARPDDPRLRRLQAGPCTAKHSGNGLFTWDKAAAAEKRRAKAAAKAAAAKAAGTPPKPATPQKFLYCVAPPQVPLPRPAAAGGAAVGGAAAGGRSAAAGHGAKAA